MRADKKLGVAKELIEEGKIKTFEDIFIYVTMTSMSSKLGMNYKRFRRLVANPGQLKYSETYSIAKVLQVDPKLISGLIHQELDIYKKPKKSKLNA
jgi:preprotein translocase subunit Sec61beta